MDVKSFLQSQTIWGAFFAVGGAVLSAFGYAVVPGAQEEVMQAVGATVTAIGGIWSIVGRFKAGGIVIKLPKPPATT